jgi:hypothetical protein
VVKKAMLRETAQKRSKKRKNELATRMVRKLKVKKRKRTTNLQELIVL